MSIATVLRAEALRHEAEVARIRHLLTWQMERLPDNPRISRLGYDCFTISSKDLGTVWSPEYHDFKYQYHILLDLCDQTGDIRRKLLTALRAKQFRKTDKALVRLHPDGHQECPPHSRGRRTR